MSAPSSSRWSAFSVWPPSAIRSSVSATVSKRKRLAERRAQRRRQRARSPPDRSTPPPRPHGVGDLAGAVGGLATGGQPRAQRRRGSGRTDPGRGRRWRHAVDASAARSRGRDDGAADDGRAGRGRTRPTASAVPPAGWTSHEPQAVAVRRSPRPSRIEASRRRCRPSRLRRSPRHTISRPSGVSTNEPGHGW